MIVYMDLENLLKEKNISKNKLCEACNLQRTQLNTEIKVGHWIFLEGVKILVSMESKSF